MQSSQLPTDPDSLCYTQIIRVFALATLHKMQLDMLESTKSDMDSRLPRFYNTVW
jgi:hypothetical protein